MLALSLLSLAAAADHWAVLIAGSNGYMNYRHHADVCHAYHVVLKKGIPPENIIVMAYDDVASSPQNPYPGKLFNKPTPKGTPGVDVYAGCNIDWRGSTVTPDNFVKVLTGDDSPSSMVEAEAQGAPEHVCNPFGKHKTSCSSTSTCCCVKRGLFTCQEYTCCDAGQMCDTESKSCKSSGSHRVLKSTNASKVFVNFVDHGGVGIIGFPGDAPFMHAKELVGALQTMHDKGMYQQARPFPFPRLAAVLATSPAPTPRPPPTLPSRSSSSTWRRASRARCSRSCRPTSPSSPPRRPTRKSRRGGRTAPAWAAGTVSTGTS